MPIVAGDLLLRLSGGSGNTNPNSSLGGVKSSTTSVTDNTLHNLFDVVSSGEASAGESEYRCLYLHNNHGSLTLFNAYCYISTQTPHTTVAHISLGDSGVNGTEQTIANENTAPSTGISWVSGTGSGNSIALGDIPAGQHRAFWIRREVPASTAAYSNDSVVIQVGGDTPA